jgi:predicted transcriptional regulator
VDNNSYINPHYYRDENMKTIQMTLDEDLVKAVDRVSKQLNTSRSAFTRKALREALDRYGTEQLERTHRKGYERHPVAADEFLVWEEEQAWGDE